MAARIACVWAAVEWVGLFACKELGGESVRAHCRSVNPFRVVMNGFMVATVNPLRWDDVRRSALSDQRRGQAPAGDLANHEPFMIGTMKVSRRDFLRRHLLRDDSAVTCPPTGGCDH